MKVFLSAASGFLDGAQRQLQAGRVILSMVDHCGYMLMIVFIAPITVLRTPVPSW
jgi:hypothetical protein